MPIDLHTHSTASDGTESPGEVVASAARAGLGTIALTDHDTASGWPEAVAAAERHGVDLVRGIEISCSHHGVSVHLLAYLLDPDDPELSSELAASRDSRERRLDRMVGAMAEDGIPITVADVYAEATAGATLGRPHIADALVRLGVVADRDAAFADYLYANSRYYVSHYAPSPVKAIRMVIQAGGVPVMAHPFAGRRGRVVQDEVIEEMAAAGLAGLEVFHRDHDGAERRHGLDLARGLGLFVTGSSDSHGLGKQNRLGENTTEPAVLATIEERATSGIEVVRA